MGANSFFPQVQDLRIPQAPSALEEFQRAANLKQAAANTQQTEAQTQGLQTQNQMADLALKDENLRRSLAPQFVQKDANGKVNGFDTQGLYSAMLANGAHPDNIRKMQISDLELQKGILGLNAERRKEVDAFHSDSQDALEKVQEVHDRESKERAAAPVAPPPAPAGMGPAVPGTGGMPAGMLPNVPAAQKLMPEAPSAITAPDIGSAPAGSPESLGRPEPGAAPTPAESAAQESQASAQQTIGPNTQRTYQMQAMILAQKYPQFAGQLPATLHSFADLQQAEADIGSIHEAMANAGKLAETKKASAEAAKANVISMPELGGVYHVDTGEFKAVNGQTMSPAMLESKYVLDQAQKQRTGQSPDPQFDAGYEKYKTMVPAFNFNLHAAGVGGGGAPPAGPGGAPLSYDQQIKSFGAKGGVVKAIIEGRQDPPASFAQKSPYWQDVMQKVYSIDPEFNQQRAQLRKAYTVGTQSKEINAINTAMGHVGVLGDAIDALHNNDTKLLNTIGNRLGIEFGTKAGDSAAMFKTIIHRVGPELSKAYIGAGGSAGERGSDEADFSENLAPSILKTNVGMTAQLLRSKISSLENQWDQNKAPGMPSFQDHFITKEAAKQLDKWSPQSGTQGGDFFSKFGGQKR